MAKLDEDIDIPVKTNIFGWVAGKLGYLSEDEKA
jgi:hypothetical protein